MSIGEADNVPSLMPSGLWQAYKWIGSIRRVVDRVVDHGNLLRSHDLRVILAAKLTVACIANPRQLPNSDLRALHVSGPPLDIGRGCVHPAVPVGEKTVAVAAIHDKAQLPLLNIRHAGCPGSR